MLTIALSLSVLLAVPVATVTYALSRDWSLCAYSVAAESSVVCCVCAYGELCVLCAHVNARLDSARFKPIRVDRIVQVHPVIPDAPERPERIRFIPMRTNRLSLASVPAAPMPTLGVDTRDLAWFISGLDSKGSHAKRKWLGRVTPSGRTVDAELYAQLIAPLVSCEAIVGRAERKAGALTMAPAEILSRLGLD